MRICIISDTHNKHKQLKNLPDADIIIHCGDMTSMGYSHEINGFMKWFGGLDQYKHKICIAGNHDWLFETNNQLAREHIPENVIYLEDNEVIINNIKFYGTPVNLPFFDWAFNRPEEKLKQHWEAIPSDTDVLITHQPPYGIFDWSVYDKKATGSPSLRNEVINRIKPKIHCFGHIHSGYGVMIIENTTLINASNLGEDYMYINKPTIIKI